MRKQLIAVLVVVLVGISGCSGLSPFGDSSTEPSPTATADTESTEPAATTTVNTEPTEPAATTQPTSPDSDIKHPSGWNETGVEDFPTAYNQHYNTLYSHDNFTRISNWTFLEPGQYLHRVARIDQSSKQQHWNTTVIDSGNQTLHEEQYQKDGMLYYTNRSNPPTYNTTSRYSFDTYMEFETNRRIGKSGPVYYTLWSSQYTDSERVVYDGETMFRYTSTQLRNESLKLDFLPPILDNMTVEEFNMTTIVDSDGMIRSSEYEITYTIEGGETHTRTGLLQFDGGETTVTEPAWVEEAKAS